MKKSTVMVICMLLIGIFAGFSTISGQISFPQFAGHFGAPAKTYVIPVYIEDTYVDINAIIFSVEYDSTSLKLRDVSNGNLTQSWDEPVFFCPERGRCNIAMVYDGSSFLLANSSGDIAILKFKVVGKKELEPTLLNLSNIQLSNANYVVGTAPAMNGTISKEEPSEVEYQAYWSNIGG